MSKFKIPTKKALDRTTNAVGTIKVVTFVILRFLPIEERYLPIPSEEDNTGQVGFITDLPTNLTLEQHMEVVKSEMKKVNLPPHVKRGLWDQFTVLLSLPKMTE